MLRRLVEDAPAKQLTQDALGASLLELTAWREQVQAGSL